MNKTLNIHESHDLCVSGHTASKNQAGGITKGIVYWTATAIIAFVLLSGGAAELARQRDTVAGTVLLGYPVYLVTILGFWKVLGAVALLAPRFPRLKEWAYAGAFFNLTGAAASHAFCGDYGKYAFHLMVPGVLAILLIVSWAMRPDSRRLHNAEISSAEAQ